MIPKAPKKRSASRSSPTITVNFANHAHPRGPSYFVADRQIATAMKTQTASFHSIKPIPSPTSEKVGLPETSPPLG